MRLSRAVFQIAVLALLVALGGLWAPSALAHSGMHAGMHATAVTKAHPAQSPEAAPPGSPAHPAHAWIAEIATADHGASPCGKLDIGCCTAGASCPAPIAGQPAAALPLPEPGRAAFPPPAECALPASDGERLPKPPRA